MKIGIPRALLYYKYNYLWENFFEELDIDYIVSPDTNKEIVRRGMTYAIDESCLSSKIYLGHVEWLLDKCDYILVPRVSDYGTEGTVCTKFQAIYDVVANTFRDRNINILFYNIDSKITDSEISSFLKLGKVLGKRKSKSLSAYLIAKQIQKEAQLSELNEQEHLLNKNVLKILLIAHRYNICDKYIGKPITNFLRALGTVPIIGAIAPPKEALVKSRQISETLPWAFNKELVGSIPLYKDRVDGIILMSTFPCGPDSLVNEIIIRRVRDKPILNLMLDGQEGNSGIETRLESFVDIMSILLGSKRMFFMEKIKASFPQLGSYSTPLELLFTEGFGVEYIVPPSITKKTLAIGSRYSPDCVCSPFKYNLGNFIETIEVGANTLIQTGGVCRLRYYGELHEQILRDLGYKVKFVNMAKVQGANPITFYNGLKEINPQMSLKKIAKILPVVMKMVEYIDEAEDFVRKNVGFEIKKGSFDKVHTDFLQALRAVRKKKELKDTYRNYRKLFQGIEIELPKDSLKVGIIGEYYTIMEPFSNHLIEKELAQMGIVVDRWLNISNTLLHYPKKQIKEHIADYAKYPMGATSMATIYRALEFAKKGYDGIIHLKSFGCTPEIDAIPVLQNISNDYKIPILYFSFDTQTSETGINTRLEAFYDMIIMRKEIKK